MRAGVREVKRFPATIGGQRQSSRASSIGIRNTAGTRKPSTKKALLDRSGGCPAGEGTRELPVRLSKPEPEPEPVPVNACSPLTRAHGTVRTVQCGTAQHTHPRPHPHPAIPAPCARRARAASVSLRRVVIVAATSCAAAVSPCRATTRLARRTPMGSRGGMSCDGPRRVWRQHTAARHSRLP